MHALLQTAYSHCKPPTLLTASFICIDSHDMYTVLTRIAPCNAACMHLREALQSISAVCESYLQVLHMIMLTERTFQLMHV